MAIFRWPHHVRGEPFAYIDGVPQRRCERCGCLEGAWSTHCPTRWLEPIERTAIKNGAIDFQDGVWVARSDLAELTIDEIKEQEWYQP